MKRTEQQRREACERRVGAAISRLTQAKTMQESAQASKWLKAWEAMLFNLWFQAPVVSVQAFNGKYYSETWTPHLAARVA